MSWIDRQLSLQVAYQISENVTERKPADLFRAMDRFYADRDLVDEHCQAQRSEATQRIAVELDRRSIPLRDPRIEAQAVAEIRERILGEVA